MASTYPLETIQSERWLAKNEKVKGAELEKAVNFIAWPAQDAVPGHEDLSRGR